MIDRSEHRSAYDAPVYPADPDCYHDRPTPWFRIVCEALLCAGVIVAAGMVAISMGAGA